MTPPLEARSAHTAETRGLAQARLLREAKTAARRARSTADILLGIPAYLSIFYVLDGIARDLDRAVADVEAER